MSLRTPTPVQQAQEALVPPAAKQKGHPFPSMERAFDRAFERKLHSARVLDDTVQQEANSSGGSEAALPRITEEVLSPGCFASSQPSSTSQTNKGDRALCDVWEK